MGIPESTSHSGVAARPRARRLTRLLAGLSTAAVGLSLLVSSASPAAAATSVTGTTTTSAATNATTAIPGMSLSGTSGTSLVTLSTDLGQVSLPTNSGLSLAYGYSSWTGTQLSFTGAETDINAALDDAEFAPGATPGTAHINLSVAPQEAGLSYSGATGHYYKYVASPGVTWSQARSAAEASSFAGQPGYLVQPADEAANDFVTSKIQGAVNVWIGGSATNTSGQPIQRTWSWVGGPLDGQMFTQCTDLTGACTHSGDTGVFHSWATDEPNNSGSEDKAVTNWSTADGLWNDLSGTNTGSIAGYVVEYGGMTNTDDSGSGFTGLGDVTSDVTVTAAAPPAAPTTVAGSTPRPLAIVATWTAPTTLNGSTLTGYTVTAAPGGATCTTADAADTDCTLTALTAGTDYTLTVVAHSDQGDSVLSAPSAAITAWDRGEPTSITRALAGRNSATVTWTPATPIGTTVGSYRAVASPGGRSCTTTGATTCTITGLVRGRRYIVRATAYTPDGAGIMTSGRGVVRPRIDVALAPATRRPGQRAWMSANGFAPHAKVTIRYRVPAGRVLAAVRADANGVIGPVAFTVPAWARGSVKIYAAGARPDGGTRYRSDVVRVIPSGR